MTQGHVTRQKCPGVQWPLVHREADKSVWGVYHIFAESCFLEVKLHLKAYLTQL